jgi:hypothetical protein
VRIESLLHAGLLFVVVIVAGFTFYGNMVTDYSDEFNTTNKIETSNVSYTELSNKINQTTKAGQLGTANKTGFMGAVNSVPIIGSTVVQVVSPIQMIVNFISIMLDSFNIGMEMVTMAFELLPGGGGGELQFFKNAVYTSITISIIIAFMALIAKRRA